MSEEALDPIGNLQVCDHESHYMTEDDGRSHWRCLRCGQITEPADDPNA